MPVSLLVKIVPLNSSRVPFLGRALYAFTLGILSRQNPELAEELHELTTPKPLRTAGPFPMESFRLVKSLNAYEPYALVISTLDWKIAEALLAGLNSVLPGEEFALDKAVFRIEGLGVQSIDYSELVTRYFPDGEASRTVEIVFDTPTSFHSAGKNVALPLPELVFGSLLERWNRYAPAAWDLDFKRFLQEQVGIAYYDIKAWNLAVAGGKQVSFVGRCGYRVLEEEPYWTRVLNLLADFAWFSGVGVKTAMGMGQVRRREGGSSLPHGSGEPIES